MAVTSKGSEMKPTMLAALLAERHRLEEDPSWLRERIKWFASSGCMNDVALYLKIEDLTLDLDWSTGPVKIKDEPTHMVVSVGYTLANLKEHLIDGYIESYMYGLEKYIHWAHEFSLGKRIDDTIRYSFEEKLGVIAPALPYELSVNNMIDELKRSLRTSDRNIKTIFDYILWFWKKRVINAVYAGEIALEVGRCLLDSAVTAFTYAASIDYTKNATVAQLYELISFYGDPYDNWDFITGRICRLYCGYGQEEYLLKQAVREVANSDNANPLSISMIHLLLKLIQDGKISRTSLSGQLWMVSLGRSVNVTNTWYDRVMNFKRVFKMDRSKDYMRNAKRFGDEELKRLAAQCPEIITLAGDLWFGV